MYYLCGGTAPPEVHFYRRSVGHVDGLSQREEDREPDKVWSWIYNYWWQDLRNLLSACKDQVASYQLNMFGVAVFGSIPRWTSLYRTESKYPANPAKMMGTTAVTKGIATVAVVKSNIHIYMRTVHKAWSHIWWHFKLQLGIPLIACIWWEIWMCESKNLEISWWSTNFMALIMIEKWQCQKLWSDQTAIKAHTAQILISNLLWRCQCRYAV